MVTQCLDCQAYIFLIDTGATMFLLGSDSEVPISDLGVNSVEIEWVKQKNHMTHPVLVSCTLDSSI